MKSTWPFFDLWLDVGQHGTNADGRAFELAECRARCRCRRELRVIERIHADSGQSLEQRQVLRQCAVKVKLSAGLILRGGVCGVEVEAGVQDGFVSVLLAEVLQAKLRLQRCK